MPQGMDILEAYCLPHRGRERMGRDVGLVLEFIPFQVAMSDLSEVIRDSGKKRKAKHCVLRCMDSGATLFSFQSYRRTQSGKIYLGCPSVGNIVGSVKTSRDQIAIAERCTTGSH